VASVRGLWAGTVAPVDADAVHVRGSGAPGAVDLVVRADPGRTSITVEGTVDGALNRVGAAVLAGAVRRMAEDLLAATAAPDRESAEPIAPGAHGTGGAPDGSGASGPSGASARRRAARGAGVLVGAAVALLVRRRARGRPG
jgi:hypothetical protein